MSSTVDDVSNISGGGLKQELLETAVQEDVLHTSTVLSTSVDEISSKLEEEQVLKSSPARMPEGTADSTTDTLVVVEKKAEILEDNNDLPSPEKMLTEPDSTGSPPQVQIKTSPLIEMPSLGPDLTITEINDDIKENDNKNSAEVSIFKVENQTINGSLVQEAMKSAMAHINGMVINGKKCTNGSTDYTSSCMPVITVNNDGEENDELTVSGDRMQVKNNPEIPAIKWGIMNKKASSPHRQKKLPILAPKPAITAAISSPQQSLSPVGPPTPQSPPPDLFLQLLRLPQPVVEKCTSPTSTSVPQQEDGKSKQLPQQQQQRPTALVNPFPAQKLVRDNSGLVTICKGTQADSGGDTVTIPAIVVNGPVAAKNQQDTQDLDKKNVCVVPKVVNRQHQRWTQTTLLDFHRIKNITTTSASNIQPVSATATVPVQQQQHQQPLQQQQQQQQQQVAIQQQQPHMRNNNKSVGSSTVGAAAMLTPVMTKLQAGGTVCVTGTGVGPNTVVGCLIQNKTEQDDASILHQLLATQQAAAAAAAASVADQTGNSVAALGSVDLQQHNVATTPAEMSVIDMLKRLGTVVELEEQKDPSPPPGDLVALTAAAPGAEQPSVVPNALALLENIKIDKPQSPVVKALEDTPASSPTSQVNKHCNIPPIPTTTFYLGKDISVFPHVTPPVTSHIPIAPVPIQPKRTTQISAKSTSTQLSSVPTQPRLPPDVSVFATTRNANNPADCKTVQQWSLDSLVKQVKGCLSPKHQQQQHPILEEVNQLNAQRNRQNQQQRSNQLPKQQQQSQVYQVISGHQRKTSPKRKSSLTKEPAQYNHVALHHLEPEIDIVEGDNVLSSEGTFIFNMDSFFNVDLPNNDMIYSCDICSAVYQHPHRLKKHYLRLHIARKYIAKRDLDAFNIDSKSECHEEDNDVEKVAKGEENNDCEIKLVFRCHTCRKCVATKAELKSHLTDHPPVVDLKKQIVKGVKNYKCDYCSVFFKWKKMFLKHKKNCRLQPSIQGTTIPAPVTPVTTTPVMAAPAKLQGDVVKPKKTIKTSATTAVVSSTTSKYTSVNTATTATATTTSVSTAITTVTTSSISTNITAVTTSDTTSTVATTTILDVNSATATTTSAVNTAPVLSTSNKPTTTVATSTNTSTNTATPGNTYKLAKAALSSTSTSKAASLVTTTTIKTASTNTSATTKAASTNTSATAKAGPSTNTSTKTSSTTTSAKTKAASSITTKATSAKSSTATKTASANISTAKIGTPKASTSSAKATAAKTSATAPTVKTASTGIVKTRRVRNSLKNVIRLLHHCLYCNETFHNGNSKRNHTLSNHPYVRKVHPCVFCQRDFVSNNSLFTHLLENHTTVYFACAACKDRFTNLQELGSHNDRKHSLDEAEKLAFNKRISTIRQDKDCYTCQTCQRMFVIESSYKSHKCTPPEQQATPEVIKREKNSSSTLNTSTTSNFSPNVSSSTITTVSGSNNTNGNNTEKNDNKPVNKVRAKKSKYNEREVKTDSRVQPIDPEVAFFSQVSRNVRENLQNHLDGRLVQSGDDSGDDMGNCSIKTEGTKKTLLKTPETGRRTRSPKIMNRLSLGSPTVVGGVGTQQKGGIVGNNALSRLSIGQDDKGVASSNQNHYSKPRASPWEKYAFPKEYDGRCGLTSYIKDISYLDISTQLIMRRNMQSLQEQDGELMDGEEWYLNGEKVDLPSVLALERMAAKCAESFSNDDSTLNGGDDPLNNDGISTANGELSGEWVRERTYVCLVCGWETHCLWSMEDHKYDVHPSVVCPRLELVGDQRKLAKKIYTRLTNAPAPFMLQSEKQHKAPQEIACTKCNSKGYATAHELHVHLLECAGEKVPEWIRNAVSGTGRSQTPRKRKWSRKRRRPRRGLKRNIPNTPQKPNKARSKPGDTDTIQKMIANLPAKRLTRRVIAFDEKDLKTRSQSHIQNPPLQQQTAKSAASKTNGAKSKNNGHLVQQHDSTTTGGAVGVMNAANKLDSSTPKATSPSSSSTLPASLKRTNNIDTSAEGGDVLSSLRMMPVSTPRPELLGTQQILDRVLGLSARVKEEEAALSSGIKCTGCGQAYESKTVLRRHHKSCAYFRECGPISQHQCQTCHKTFDNLVALIEHTCEEIPPRLEAEESMTSKTETVSSTAAQVDNKDIPVLSPALEGDNKVESKVKGEKTHKSSSTPFGEAKENVTIPLVVKEENIEKSKKMPLSQTTAVQTVDHYTTYTNEVPMLPISSTTPAPAAAGGGAVSSFLNVPYHSVKTASLICGISFVDGFIKYETVNSVSKETETILELSGTKKGDNLNKRGRPKRKSGEEASVALFHTMNSGRRSNSGARAEKNETTKIRKTKKGVARKSEMPDDKIVAQTAETTVSSNSPAKTIQRRGRGKPKVSSTIVHSAIQEPVVSSDLPEDEIKVKIETDDKEDKVKSGNDDKEVTVSLVEESKIRRKRKWSNSPIKKEENVNSNTEDINNSQTTSPNQSGDNLSPTVEFKRKRGRPFGSLSRKSNGLPERRSSRCRARNSSALETIPTSTRTTKFEKSDDILLFDEEEDLVKGSAQKRVMSTDKSPSKQSSELESQEKKRRNRWSGKQQPCRDNSPDTTTIVVQAEVHPEPSPRRIRKELTLSGAADEQLNSEEKPAEACRKTSLGRKKRIEQEPTHNLKSIKKAKTEVGITTSVDEISVLEVEEIVMENATADEDSEITSRMEKLESPSIDKKEINCPESSVDGVVNINDIKHDLKDEYIEEIETKEEPGEIVDTTMNENENLETQEIEHTVQESEKTSYVKKMKKKNKKKKKVNTLGLQRSTSPQQSLSSVKKIKKISKDEKLKKNIKAAALSIARLKKKKKILQIKNDRRQDNKKEVVKVAGFSWEVSELAKSPEKSPVTASTQLENNAIKPIDSILCPADTKDGILQPQTVCSCSNRSSPIQQAAAFTATSSTSVLHMAQATDINPPTPATFHYTLTKEDWLSQTTAPLASSTVHPVHPVPIVHQLATSSVSQTLCTLQPAILNHQHQQQAQNNVTSLIQQVGACQATVALNQQQQDISASSAPVLHTPHIANVPTTRQQTIGPDCAATVGPKHSASEAQPVQLVNSLQFTENSLINVPQQSIGQPLLPQHVSHTSVSHTMAQTAVQATSIYTSPLQHVPVSSQLEFHPPTKTIPATIVDQMVIPPPPSFQSSPPCHQVSMVQSQQQMQISSTTCKQIPASFQSSVNPTLSISTVSSSRHQEIDIGPVAAVPLQPANSSPAVDPNTICTVPTSQLQCYPTNQSLTTEEGTVQPVLLDTLQSQQQSVVQNQQNFTSLSVVPTQIAEQQTNLISSVPSVSLPLTSETAQLTSSNIQSSQTITPIIKTTATIQDCITPSSSNQLMMDQQLPAVSGSTLGPSLGTIIDSVNKLLNEPELSTGSYSPLSHYSCMTDIHNYCTEDDITVLQHLGEAAAVEMQDGMPDLKANINTRLQMTTECETDYWSPGDSKSLMDLDNQPPQEQPPPVTVHQQDIVSNTASTSSNGYVLTQENTSRSLLNLQHLKDEINNTQGIRKRRASPALKLMDAYEGKEVVCPTCHSQFLGFSALQAHVEKAHNQHSSAQTSGNNNNSTVTQTGQVTSINRRVVLESCKGNRRVCHVCQQILPANLMMSHLSDEHALDHSSFLGDPSQDPACGERLKTKLAAALGDLLDKAVHNLVLSKPRTESQLSAGAAELLSRLCAIRLKDSSFKQRLNPKEKPSDTEELIGAKLKELAKSYPCEFCGLKFITLCSKKKHQKLAHPTMKTPDQIIDTYSDIDEYENDWRGVPSPNSSNNDGTGDPGDTFHPTCSECGLSFPTLSEMMRHRTEDHGRQGRRLSSDIGMSSSRPHTPSSVHNSNVSCGSGSGSATPNNINTVSASNSSCLNSSTAVSLANTLSRLQQRTRSSSVETQSSCGGSSVTTTTNSSRGGRAGSKGRGGGNSGRTVTSSQLKTQQCQVNPSGDDDAGDSSSSSKEVVKGKSRRSVNKKSNTPNSKKQQTTTGGGQQKCNNNGGGSNRSQRGGGGGGRAARRGSLQNNKTLSTSVEEAAKAEQALLQLTRERSGSNMLRNRTTNNTTTSSTDTATTLATAVAVTNNSNNCQLPSLQSNILI